MAGLVQFLLDVAEGRYSFGSNASQRIVCFVSREPQALIPDFMRRVALFENVSFRYSDLAAEQAHTKYDSADQQSLFGDTSEIEKGSVCWLHDFPQSSDTPFLTSQQRQAKYIELQALSNKRSSLTYCFSLTQREFDANPHALESLGVYVVTIPESLDLEAFGACAYFYQLPSTCSVDDLYAIRSGCSFDDALIVIEHGACVSRRGIDAFKKYSDYLVASDVQLRDLSEYFWSKDAKRFFTVWNRMSAEYGEQFWISYWSTQFFLAYFFMERAASNPKTSPQGQEHALAPWFTWKAGWKKYSQAGCVALHNRLYDVDCELKNGSGLGALELFLNKHFLG